MSANTVCHAPTYVERLGLSPVWWGWRLWFESACRTKVARNFDWGRRIHLHIAIVGGASQNSVLTCVWTLLRLVATAGAQAAPQLCLGPRFPKFTGSLIGRNWRWRRRLRLPSIPCLLGLYREDHGLESTLWVQAELIRPGIVVSTSGVRCWEPWRGRGNRVGACLQPVVVCACAGLEGCLLWPLVRPRFLASVYFAIPFLSCFEGVQCKESFRLGCQSYLIWDLPVKRMVCDLNTCDSVWDMLEVTSRRFAVDQTSWMSQASVCTSSLSSWTCYVWTPSTPLLWWKQFNDVVLYLSKFGIL